MKQNTIKPIDYLDHQDLFFISDLHIGHANVIRFDNRPFKDTKEMSEEIIKRWNSVVSEDSIVYFLGDFMYKSSRKNAKWFADQLNGDIRVILGNHDRIKDIEAIGRFSDVQTYKRLEVPDQDDNGKEFRQTVILSHYPMLSWDKAHHGSFLLHGHCHQSLTETDYGKEVYYKRKVLDMGCNGWDYTPVSYKEIKEVMKSKNSSNHH